ncbi:hypothetical protein GBA52_026344 [Prunus armeniaca]|nr:hypothetical protein GBA52_026344 [Prunus armeniaca]
MTWGETWVISGVEGAKAKGVLCPLSMFLRPWSIPDSIAGLEKLEQLHVSSYLLVSLPNSVGLLLNLRVLNVSGNKLDALPESIARCR